MSSLRCLSSFLIIVPLFAAACAQDSAAHDEAFDETGLEGPLEEIPAGDDKYDGASARGPRVGAGTQTEVWAVTRQWADVETEAGVSWEGDSGLDWEQKYDRWISSFTTEPRSSGSGQTFVMPTPYGERAFHAPTLECAEVAIFLRVTFSSWYHLPFYFAGWDSRGRKPLYAGHFGFIHATGERVANFPRFRTSYRDYESSWSVGDDWPSDSVLRGRRLGTDDEVGFLSTDGKKLGAGAYFDEVFLNKRVGHFMRLILLYFGSANLADGSNMFHIVPEAIEGGDLLIERWQRRGIGHVMPIFLVERESEDALQVSIASGSMPRREPYWEGPNTARSSFLLAYTGGVGETTDGVAYAALGGGVRRWRTAILKSGRWYNDVHPADRDVYIASTDLEAIAARPARFNELLRTLSSEEKRDAAIQQIEAAREHLRNYPASCAARTRREDAFAALYEVMTSELGWTRGQVDAEFRALEDYVFAELDYEVSRTCCWNRSNGAMHDIVMSYAEAEVAAASAGGMCVMPTVFRAESEGYERWKQHAAEVGRADEWRPWTEDESCSQRDVPEDTVSADRDIVDYCAIADVDPAPAEPACDPEGGDDTMSSATPLTGVVNAEICGGDDDWYRVEGDATVVVTFVHDDGDIDVEAYDQAGEAIGQSTSISDEETVSGTGTFYVRVYGYAGAQNRYRIAIDG